MLSPIPLVSICIPTYGRAAFLGDTLRSALAQTVEDFEVIVVDDASPDGTADVVRSFADPRIRYSRNVNNLGVPDNLNYVFSLARGEFLLLLEDHDLLAPTYLTETLAIMRRYPSVGFVATGLFEIDQRGSKLKSWVKDFNEMIHGHTLLRRLLTRASCPFSVTALIRADTVKEIQPIFDNKYGWYADQHLWMQLSAKADFGYVAKPLFSWRTREDDHYLNDQVWESQLCLYKIHMDNWQLLHPKKTWASCWDQILYAWARFNVAARMRGGRMLRKIPWTSSDRTAARNYLSPFGALMLSAVGMLPFWVIRWARTAYYARQGKLTKAGCIISPSSP